MRSIHQDSVQCAFDFGKKSGNRIFPLKNCPDSTRKLPATAGIYMMVNCVNHHVYVGSAKNLLDRRHRHQRDLKAGNHKNHHLQRAYDCYGADAFRFVVLEHVAHVEHLLAREQHYIDTRNPEYNIARTAGSNLGMTYSPETKAKMRAARLANENMPEQMKQLGDARRGKPLSLAHRAKITANQTGRSLSPESRAKLSAANRGKKKPPEHGAKVAAAKRGKPRSPETIAKVSAAKLGKKASPETKAKMSVARLGKKKPPEFGAKISATKRAKKLAQQQAFQPPLF